MTRDIQPSRSFYYPDQRGRPSHRTCAKGQRRIALDGTLLHEEHKTGIPDEQVTRLLTRASRAELLLARDIRPSKDDIIAYQSVSAYVDGRLGEYVGPDGKFLLETADGARLPRNVHREKEDGKDFYEDRDPR